MIKPVKEISCQPTRQVQFSQFVAPGSKSRCQHLSFCVYSRVVNSVYITGQLIYFLIAECNCKNLICIIMHSRKINSISFYKRVADNIKRKRGEVICSPCCKINSYQYHITLGIPGCRNCGIAVDIFCLRKKIVAWIRNLPYQLTC